MTPVRTLFLLVAVLTEVDCKEMGELGLREAQPHEIKIDKKKLAPEAQAKANVDLINAAGQGDFAEVCSTSLSALFHHLIHQIISRLIGFLQLEQMLMQKMSLGRQQFMVTFFFALG
jgi:hypothetical protein